VENRARKKQVVEMTVCGKHGKTIKLFSQPSPSPWKSLRRFPHYHRLDYDGHQYTQNPKNQDQRNDAQYHYPGEPNQMIKVGHAGIANSNELTPPDLAAREHLEDALDRFNEAIDRFHEETPGNDGLLDIELYPCDDECEECEAA